MPGIFCAEGVSGMEFLASTIESRDSDLSDTNPGTPGNEATEMLIERGEKEQARVRTGWGERD